LPPGKPQQGVVPALADHWLVQVPESDGSWVLPLDVQPRGPTAGTPTPVAIHQVAQARASQASETPRPVVALDSAHDVGQLAQAHLDADLVVRLANNRVSSPRSGAVLRPRSASQARPGLQAPGRAYPRPSRPLGQPGTPGVWDRDGGGLTRLHVQAAAPAPCTVLRVQVEQLPRHGRPTPLWLAWIGWELPNALHQVWQWYPRRFTVEHAVRFAKPRLGWTTVRPATQRRPTAGPGCWPQPCGSSGWPDCWWRSSDCPGSTRCGPSA